MWIIGLLFFASSVFVEHQIYHSGTLHTWEQWFVTFTTTAVSIWFFIEAQMESILFDKSKGRLTVTFSTLCCSRVIKQFALADILSVRAVRHGRKRSYKADSTCYAIKVYFKDG